MAAAAGHDRAGGSLCSRCSRRLAGRWARRRSCRFPRRPCPGFRAPARLPGVGPLRSLLAGRLRVRARCPRPACVRAAARGRRGSRPPRRSRACCGVLFRRFSALAALGRRPGSRVLFPPGLRRRRPSRRRFAVRWRGRVPSGAWGGVGRLPRPLAVSPSSAWAAWPLAALCFASPRRAVVRLPVLFRARGAPPGAVAGGCSGVWSGVGLAGAFLAAAPAVFFSPLTTPLFSPWRWRAAMRSISVRGAKNSCAPVRPLADRLSCGRGPRLGCVRGRRAWAVVLPPLACALRLPRRVRPPAPSRGGRPRRLVGRVRR